MADISKINLNDSTEYNIKDTTARNGLTDRPTSFVGTRSEWNALPVATQVKYSLVNLIGEGVYKNNGTGLDDIANTGGASKNFQGTIEEWNALTTEQKKAYDHASIPDSLDGNVTFPASKVMMQNGNSVQNEMHYKYGGAIVGTDGLQLPNDWNELLIFAQYGTSGGLQNQTLQVTINKDITSKLPYGAYIFGAGTMAGQAYISNNTLSLLSFQVNGTEYKTTSRILYYYR